jgi:hypothetical protein
MGLARFSQQFSGTRPNWGTPKKIEPTFKAKFRATVREDQMMRRHSSFLVTLVSFTLLVPTLALAQARSGSRPATNNAGGEGDDPYAGMRHFWAKRTHGNRPIPPGAYEKAKRQWENLPKATGIRPGKANASGLISSLNGVVWRPIGPSPITAGNSLWNGRINSIAINPNNPKVIYAGTTGGGVWRSNDAGNTWSPLIDHEPMIAIGEPNALTIDPTNTNTVYVGSSTQVNNTTLAQGVTLNRTLGVLKTTDGGGSWIALGSGFPANNNGNASQFQNRDVYAITVDPANSNVLNLASSTGLYRSVDSGQNWTAGTNGAGLAQSLALDASSPAANRVLFAGMNGSGIFRSNDGGVTWTQVLSSTTGAVANALAGHVLPPPAALPSIGKVAIALAPPAAAPNPAGVQVIYATLEGKGGNFIANPYYPILGIFESTDQGATWTQRTANNIGQCQCFYTNTIAIDPNSPGDGANDVVYWGGTNTFRSADSGSNFTDITNGIHADSHAWAFVRQPNPPAIVYAGNDGGIWRSTNSGGTWTGTNGGGAPTTINSGALQVGLFYHMDFKRDATGSVTLGALQDIGTVKGTGAPTWNNTQGGDGFVASFDQTGVPANQSIAYSVNNGGPARSTDSGGTWADVTNNIPNNAAVNKQIQTFFNTLNVDPSNSANLYFGGAANTPPKLPTVPGQLFQSTNSGGTWRQITSFTANANVGPAAVAPANSNFVAVADGNFFASTVYLSTNALAATVGPPNGVVFTNITRNLPGRAVTRLAFDPNDPTVLYAVLSGFGGGHIFQTTVNGTAWTDISPPVDVPFDGIAVDGASSPSTLYVGTDLGVLRSVDGGNNWATLDALHFPNSPVTDLQLNSQSGILRASTFGRGVFDFGAPTGPVVTTNAENGLNFGSLCPGSSATLKLSVINIGTQDLIVYNVQNLFNTPGFSITNSVPLPVSISPNAQIDFTVQFTPFSRAFDTADIRVTSNDPNAPFVDLTATGSGFGAATIGTSIADTGNFGGVCIGSFVDLPLTINNSGTCPLQVNGIIPSDPEFLTPNTLSFPFTVAPGASLQLNERFQPALPTGNRVATVDVTSSDPITPNAFVPVSGQSQAPLVSVTGTNNFGNVCAGIVEQETFKVCNLPPAGMCQLNVTNVMLNAGCKDFTIESNPFPEYLGAEMCGNVVVQFTPTSDGTKTCNLIVTSSDPATPIDVIPLTGTTPIPSISISPALAFPPTVEGNGKCAVTQLFPVTNTGICPLTVTGVTLGPPDAVDYGLHDLPSQRNVLPPGGSLSQGGFGIRFQPVELNRNVDSSVDVTYISDPILNTKTTVDKNLCGEGVFVGARVLVTLGGVPVSSVDRIQLIQVSTNTVIDNVFNAKLKTITPTIATCSPFQFQREYGTVSDPKPLAPGSYQVKVTLTVAGKQLVKTVTFNDNTCGFAHPVVVAF